MIKQAYYTFVLIFFAFLSESFGVTYRVGPGHTYDELGKVPWINLAAGDTVLIYWRSEPYASKIFIRAQGTGTNPVVIRGVPGPNGDLPVITGENATTNSQFEGYFSSQWTEDLGLFLIYRGPDDDYYSYNPQHIVFEYLEMTGAKPSNTFTDQYGNTRNYNNFSSAIHALVVDDLTVRHCKIHDNAQGIFTNSNGTTEGEISRNTLIEYNEIWGNGLDGAGNGFVHNVYIQSAGAVIQYNYFGSPRAGSHGANIKDRSSGTIIRYNWIEGAARILDLVETEDAAPIIMNEPDYHDVYVYGNVITNYLTKDPFGSNLIHFGFDNSPVEAKRGTLYFYNNTVYIEGDETDWWNVRLFDVTDDADPTTTEGTVAMYNNIIHKRGTTNLQMMRDGGTLAFYANNWIVEGYENLGYGSTASVITHTLPITGTDPGFIDETSENFALENSSPVVDISGDLPQQINVEYPLNKEYVKHANVKNRVIQGNAMDLGAFESENNQNAPSAPQNLTSSGQTSTTISLTWSPSVGSVTGYKVYRDGVEITIVSDTVFTDTGLSPATIYEYAVSAVDSVLKTESKKSDIISVTTADEIVTAITTDVSAAVSKPYIHPIPAEHYIYIVGGETNNFKFLDVVSLSGRVVFSTNISSIIDPINVSGLSEGVYILRLHAPHGIIRLKFAKK